MLAKPLYTVGSTLRLPFGQRRYDVNAITERDGAVFYRFNIATGDSYTAHKWYAEAVLKKFNPVLWAQPVLTVVPSPADSRRWMAQLRHAAGRAVWVEVGSALDTVTINAMRQRADAAARHTFDLCQQATGDERARLAYAGGLLLGAAAGQDKAQIITAAAAARRVLVSLQTAANVKVIETMRTGEQAA